MTGLSIAAQVQAIHAAIYCQPEAPAYPLPGRKGMILASLPRDPERAINAAEVCRATELSPGTVHPSLIDLVRMGYVSRQEEHVGALIRVTYWRVK